VVYQEKKNETIYTSRHVGFPGTFPNGRLLASTRVPSNLDSELENCIREH
jgi:hypothetical protein